MCRFDFVTPTRKDISLHKYIFNFTSKSRAISQAVGCIYRMTVMRYEIKVVILIIFRHDGGRIISEKAFIYFSAKIQNTNEFRNVGINAGTE